MCVLSFLEKTILATSNYFSLGRGKKKEEEKSKGQEKKRKKGTHGTRKRKG
jgi:hypothetical protein